MKLTDDQLDRLEDAVYRLLEDVGMEVETPALEDNLCAAGCKPLSSGRLSIPRALASEVVAVQNHRREQGEAFTRRPGGTGFGDSNAAVGCSFGPGPTRYLDIAMDTAVPITEERANDMIRMSDACPHIGSAHPWFVKAESPKIECVENLARALKVSKKVSGIDAIYPAQVKYLLELSRIVTGDPESMALLGGSQCMTPPIVMSDRSAQEMIERARHGAPYYYVASMTMIGATAPATRWGVVVQASAEILGGWVAAHAICDRAFLGGSPHIVSMDMASGHANMTAPEMAWTNGAMLDLFDRRLGGHMVRSGTQYSPTAARPGLQAVFENLYTMTAAVQFEDKPLRFIGKGLLAVGNYGCPEQLMLDVETGLALRELTKAPPDLDDDQLAMDVMAEQIPAGRSFMEHVHTATHCRELFRPGLLPWDGRTDGSEAAILDRARQQWQDWLARYEPPDWPDDTLRAIEDVRLRARRELLEA